MTPSRRRRSFRGFLSAMIIGLVLMLVGGCPVDRDAVVQETVRAGLQAALDSFVDALGEYLAGN